MILLVYRQFFKKLTKRYSEVPKMWINNAMSKLSNIDSYCRKDLFQIFLSEKEDLSDSTFRWTLYNLLKENKLFKIGYDTYIIAKPKVLPVYKPFYSKKTNNLIDFLKNNFLGLNFVVFESVLLNEFLNHQIAQNTVYIQVEKDMSSYVFDILQDKYTERILYKPNNRDFDRYWTKDCIVILDLISQAPLSVDKPYEITIEKILVDIIADKSISATFSSAEIPFIFYNVMKSYQIDKHKIKRYAGRRGRTNQIMNFLGDME